MKCTKCAVLLDQNVALLEEVFELEDKLPSNRALQKKLQDA